MSRIVGSVVRVSKTKYEVDKIVKVLNLENDKSVCLERWESDSLRYWLVVDGKIWGIINKKEL